ncbi:DUF2911 domain-containing protein [Ferruginibacter sp. HRS2-29]|uniref:DUF2911 domain-containing protein n=1 Tax=Ferruginibacter sp. HRS2-29 TaxID=2487334 RepID=UPI0020CEC5FC|nr:DUF2911 domain-containing protein [Ferruginibacter sp. HRS2-29]MCP9751497.1 DUF2911 domain-containing protein [Ferruginibacter sp. HRS2-29]
MKKVFLAVSLSFAFCVTAFSQAVVPAVDKSPLDISYYPNNYTLLKIQDKLTEPLMARVIYSRPQKNNRAIFGDLIEFGKVWRLGANEATEIEFFQNVKIGGTTVKKGRYTIYSIPNADKWTIILNKELDTWGSFKYDQKKDVLRVDVPVQKEATPTESFSMFFEKTTSGFSLNAVWDSSRVSLPISL